MMCLDEVHITMFSITTYHNVGPTKLVFIGSTLDVPESLVMFFFLVFISL